VWNVRVALGSSTDSHCIREVYRSGYQLDQAVEPELVPVVEDVNIEIARRRWSQKCVMVVRSQIVGGTGLSVRV